MLLATQFQQIPSSGVLTAPFAHGFGGGVMLHGWMPTSCALFLRGGLDATSANFARLLNPTNPSTIWFAAVGSGRFSVDITEVARGVPWLIVEASATQGAVASLALTYKDAR